jgi:hypothetical protein
MAAVALPPLVQGGGVYCVKEWARSAVNQANESLLRAQAESRERRQDGADVVLGAFQAIYTLEDEELRHRQNLVASQHARVKRMFQNFARWRRGVAGKLMKSAYLNWTFTM